MAGSRVDSLREPAGQLARRPRAQLRDVRANEHPLLRLQSLTGNAAISSLLESGRVSQGAAPPQPGLRRDTLLPFLARSGGVIVQRQAATAVPATKEAPSLASGTEVDEFSRSAVGYWRGNPQHTLKDLATYLFNQTNPLLRQNGVPPMTLISGPTQRGDLGEFSDADWTIKVDLDEFASDTQPPIPRLPLHADSPLSEVGVEAVAKLAGTYYHEARHCEMAFLRVRLAAEQMKGPKSQETVDPDQAGELARIEEVPVRIAWEALDTTAALSDKERAKIEKLVPMETGGKHYDYRKLNDALAKLTAELVAIIQQYLAKQGNASPRERFGPLVKVLNPAIHDWIAKYRPQADAILERVQSVKPRSQVDDDVERFTLELRDDLDRMAIGVERLESAVKTSDDDVTKPKKKGHEELEAAEASLQGLQIEGTYLETWLAILELKATSGEAYRAYPHEVDTYALMGRVESDVQQIAFKAELEGGLPAPLGH